jgi:hypothetical protein
MGPPFSLSVDKKMYIRAGIPVAHFVKFCREQGFSSACLRGVALHEGPLLAHTVNIVRTRVTILLAGKA